MKSPAELYHRIAARCIASYIQFVYRSMQVTITGNRHLLDSREKERFIYTFWHGDSFCFYPVALNKKVYVLTTKNLRGDYIASISRYFGYVPMRVPDKNDGGTFFLKIRKHINSQSNFAVALDGPLGPYHIPQVFPFAMALITKHRVLPLTVRVKREIHMEKRWDHYSIPLPFNRIELQVHDPVRVERKNMDDDFSSIRENVKRDMENYAVKTVSNQKPI